MTLTMRKAWKAASTGIEAVAPCRASKGDPHEIIDDHRPGRRRLGPKVPAPTHP
jgi:hypothetical protein